VAHVLIIDDNDQVAELVKEALAGGGHTSERAAAAYGACLRAMHSHFDMVLMDLLLQGANGAVAALALRGLGYDGPILVVTGNLMPIDQGLYDRAGFAGKLLKPFKLEELLAEVEKFTALTASPS
jgi:CheY-like chemotaxis protein